MNFSQFFTRNKWWGKLIGALFGYLIAGPAGALIGILIGNLIDKSRVAFYHRPQWLYFAEKRRTVQRIFFEATFTVMGYIAKSDGRVSEQEIQVAKTLMDEMRLNREQRLQAQQFFNAGKSSQLHLSSLLDKLHKTCIDTPALINLFMDIQYRTALADYLTESKIAALDAVFKQLGYAPLHSQYRFYEDFGYQHYKPSASQKSQSRQQNYQSSGKNHSNQQGSLSHAYAILGVESSAAKQEIKRAYRKQMSHNHPDKLIAQGLPEEMIKIANDKTQQIRKAYELICASKGW